ncbi:MAG: helix-turn-helix domain-containing protein [Candidatus Verstraetearchaeota archaeon]|nr:helix-turn-helix domain-containing protein [Candidatus Verstraetearchaeota archaeon]
MSWSGEGLALEKLTEVGLTEAEAHVYLALLKRRAEMGAREVSEASGIPYSKVYTVLEKLASKSLISVRRGRPTSYIVRMPSEALNEYRRLVVREVEEKFREVEAALETFQAETAAEKPDIWIIKSPEEIVRRARLTVSGAVNEVDVALPFVPNWAVEVFLPAFLRLKANNILTKVLLSSGAGEEKLGSISEMSDLRVRDKMFGGGVIADESEAILFIASEGATPIIAIWSNHAGLVQIAKTYFDNLWNSSVPYAQWRKYP